MCDGAGVVQRVAEYVVAAVLAYQGVKLAKDYDEIAENAMNQQRQLADRQIQIARELQAHFLGTQYNQLITVINEAINVEIPTYSPRTLVTQWYSYSNTAFNAASASTTRSMKRYNIPNWPSCDKEMQIARSAAAADGAMSRMRQYDRRVQTAWRLRGEAAANAYKASTEDAGPIFGLLQNAQKLYGEIGQSALVGFNGAMSTIGMAMNVFHGTYGGGS